VAAQTDPVSGEASGQGFDFHAVGLTAREFETLRVVVDGVELTPEGDPVNDAPVTRPGSVVANDTSVDASEGDATVVIPGV